MCKRNNYKIFIFLATLLIISSYLTEKLFSIDENQVQINRSLGVIKIGCLLPLSGKNEKLGNSALRGIFAAIESAKDNKYSFQVIIKDFEEDPVKLRKALYELVNEDNISLLIGPLPSSFAKDVFTTISTLKIPTLIFPVSNNLAPESPYFIKYSFPIELQTQILAKYAIDIVKIDNFGVLYPKTAIGELFKTSFVRNVKSFGKVVKHVASYNPNLSDIDTEIEWLSLVSPQGIFIPDSASRSREIMMKLKNKLYIGDTLFMGPNTWNSGSFTKDLGHRIDAEIFKVLFTDYFYPRSPAWVNFNKHFQSVIGEDAGFFEFQVYQGVSLILGKLKEAQGSRSLLLNSIIAGANNPEFSITMTKYGTIEISPKPLLLTIKNGEIINLM